jgi:hypothetical protein
MSAELIFEKIVAVLKANTTLTAYVKAVYKGSRAVNWKANFPNIIVEPVSNPTTSTGQDNIKENEFACLIVGSQLVDNPEYQIVGVSTFKGVLDMETDIKAALFAYFPDLTQNCLYFTLSTEGYDVSETGNVRSVHILMKIIYREA